MRFTSLAATLLLSCVALDARGAIVTGADAGAGPHVKVFDSSNGDQLDAFFPYNPMFSGGVRVASGDVNGDGVPDNVIGAGPAGGTRVQALDGLTGDAIHDFPAYELSFPGGVYVASGDVDLDGFSDIVTGRGAGGAPEVTVFTGQSGSVLWTNMAYGSAFTGGVRVATGDVDGDGMPEVITAAGPGGGPHIKVFSGSDGSEIDDFFAYDQGYSGGVYVATGDINGDGIAEIITGSGTGGAPHVRIFSGQTGAQFGTLIDEFLAYGEMFSGGVRVAAGDVNGDGFDEIITGAGPGGGPHLKVFDGLTHAMLQEYMAYNADFDGGIFVAYRPDVVPEPGALAMLALGVAGVLGWRVAQR